MDYKLALELKNAGFPQGNLPNNSFSMIYPKDQQWIEGGFPKSFPPEFPNALHIYDEEGKLSVGAYAPTLSELIEECGEDFRSLSRESDTWYCNQSPMFEDTPTRDGVFEGMDFGDADGKTPEEAVARLWLALHGSELKPR